MNFLIEITIVQKIVLAFLIGALLGLEREHSKQQEIVGLRTFSLISLLGCLLGLMGPTLNASYLPVIGFFLIGLLSFALYLSNLFKFKEIGLTTTVSMLLAYVIGMLISINHYTEAVFIGVMVALVLFTKERVHSMVHHITHREMLDLLGFLIIIGIIYPFIPTQPIDLSIVTIDLKTLWLLIVLISVINLVGFLASRIFATRESVTLTALLGGLISQKASYASSLEAYKNSENLLISSLLLVNASLLVRNMVILGLFVPAILKNITIPVAGGFLVFFALGCKNMKGKRAQNVKITSPFAVKKAIELSLKLFLLIVIFELLNKYLPETLFFVGIFLGGIISSSSTVASLAMLTNAGHLTLSKTVLGFGVACASDVLLGGVPVLWMKKNLKIVPKLLPHYFIGTLVFMTLLIICISCG